MPLHVQSSLSAFQTDHKPDGMAILEPLLKPHAWINSPAPYYPLGPFDPTAAPRTAFLSPDAR